MSALLADLGARLAGALSPLASALTYRETATFPGCRAAAAASAGAGTVSLANLPNGLTAAAVGDKLTIGTGTYTVTGAVTASGGSLTNVPVTPNLAANLASGATVGLTRTTEWACQGWREEGGISLTGGSLILSGESVFSVLVNSLAVEPKAGAAVVAGGKIHTIKTVAPDNFGAVWRLTGG